MTALAGSSLQPADTAYRHDVQAPTAHLAVGLAFGAIGALFVAIGAIGLPVALVTVAQGHAVGPTSQGVIDTGARIAPLVAVVGLAHLVTAAGLVSGRRWGRALGMVLATLVVVGASAAMVVVGAGGGTLTTSSHAAAAAGASGLAALGFLVLGYATAGVAIFLRRAA